MTIPRKDQQAPLTLQQLMTNKRQHTVNLTAWIWRSSKTLWKQT